MRECDSAEKERKEVVKLGLIGEEIRGGGHGRRGWGR
jgi:hypothetical protein